MDYVRVNRDPFADARDGWAYDTTKLGLLLTEALEAATIRLCRRRLQPGEAKQFVRALFREFAPDAVEFSRQHRLAFRTYAEVGEAASLCMEHFRRIERGLALRVRHRDNKTVHGDPRIVVFLCRWFKVPEPPKPKKKKKFRIPPGVVLPSPPPPPPLVDEENADA